LGKIYDRLDKLEQAVESVRKLIKKISEGLSGGSSKTSVSTVISSTMVDVSKEDFDKLRQEFTDFAVMTDKSMGRVKEELDTKATLIELANLQAGLMDKLNELMGNLENMFADKEGTRKKIAQIEKSVSLIFIIF